MYIRLGVENMFLTGNRSGCSISGGEVSVTVRIDRQCPYGTGRMTTTPVCIRILTLFSASPGWN